MDKQHLWPMIREQKGRLSLLGLLLFLSQITALFFGAVLCHSLQNAWHSWPHYGNYRMVSVASQPYTDDDVATVLQLLERYTYTSRMTYRQLSTADGSVYDAYFFYMNGVVAEGYFAPRDLGPLTVKVAGLQQQQFAYNNSALQRYVPHSLGRSVVFISLQEESLRQLLALEQGLKYGFPEWMNELRLYQVTAQEAKQVEQTLQQALPHISLRLYLESDWQRVLGDLPVVATVFAVYAVIFSVVQLLLVRWWRRLKAQNQYLAVVRHVAAKPVSEQALWRTVYLAVSVLSLTLASLLVANSLLTHVFESWYFIVSCIVLVMIQGIAYWRVNGRKEKQ